MSRYPGRSRSRGVALLTVLMVTALASAIALGMLAQHRMGQYRTLALIESEQARLYALGGEGWARELLWQDFRTDAQSDAPYDGLDEPWARTDESIEV